jgi:nucleotide-binding universal stress UspA family protein
MPTTLEARAPTRPDLSQQFARVLVGVDGSTASLEAARQAAVLASPRGQLTILGAWRLPPRVDLTAEIAFREDADVFRREADESVGTAVEAVLPRLEPTTKVVCGPAWQELIRQATRGTDGLLVVGSHGRGRLHGILIGSTTTELVHEAHCSVLVARPAGDDFPRLIVVGVDGSAESAAAYETAASLAARFGAELWPVVAHGGKGVDPRRVAAIVEQRPHEDLPDDPVDALLAAAADADLLVVGSRGLHGVKALGSVSERIAHRAHSSVLIVRELGPRPGAA